MEKKHAEIRLGENLWTIDLDTSTDGFELTVARNGDKTPTLGWTEDPQGNRDAVFLGDRLWEAPARWQSTHQKGGTLDWLLHGSERITVVVKDGAQAARFTAGQQAPREWAVKVEGPFRNTDAAT